MTLARDPPKRYGVIPRCRDKFGFWRDARSECCYAPVVYLRDGIYVRWDGKGNLPDMPLRCLHCDQELTT